MNPLSNKPSRKFPTLVIIIIFWRVDGCWIYYPCMLFQYKDNCRKFLFYFITFNFELLVDFLRNLVKISLKYYFVSSRLFFLPLSFKISNDFLYHFWHHQLDDTLLHSFWWEWELRTASRKRKLKYRLIKNVLIGYRNHYRCFIFLLILENNICIIYFIFPKRSLTCNLFLFMILISSISKEFLIYEYILYNLKSLFLECKVSFVRLSGTDAHVCKCLTVLSGSGSPLRSKTFSPCE